MRLLLDTHVLLWGVLSPERLSRDARDALRDPQRPVVALPTPVARRRPRHVGRAHDGAPSAVTVSVAGGAPAEIVRLTPEGLQQLAAWQPLLAITLWQEMGAQVAARLRRLQPGD